MQQGMSELGEKILTDGGTTDEVNRFHHIVKTSTPYYIGAAQNGPKRAKRIALQFRPFTIIVMDFWRATTAETSLTKPRKVLEMWRFQHLWRQWRSAGRLCFRLFVWAMHPDS